MSTHSYTRENGWEVLAGADITDKRYKTTRYMLLYNANRKINRGAILTAGGSGKERTAWKLLMEGKAFDLAQAFDKLDGGALDG